jgi:hypothetical protein
VSPYLTDGLHPGDSLELRGLVGGWFVWHPWELDPVLLLGGGSGVVPLLAMVRPAGRPGGRASTDQDRTVWTKRRLKGGSDDRLDDVDHGNALAGPLHDVFRPDVTAAMAGCSNCGWTGPMGGVRVFDQEGPGLVARCPSCDQVLLRVVHGPGRAWLDLRGLSYLQLPMTRET